MDYKWILLGYLARWISNGWYFDINSILLISYWEVFILKAVWRDNGYWKDDHYPTNIHLYPFSWYLSKSNPFIIQDCVESVLACIFGCKNNPPQNLPSDSHWRLMPNALKIVNRLNRVRFIFSLCLPFISICLNFDAWQDINVGWVENLRWADMVGRQMGLKATWGFKIFSRVAQKKKLFLGKTLNLGPNFDQMTGSTYLWCFLINC